MNHYNTSNENKYGILPFTKQFTPENQKILSHQILYLEKDFPFKYMFAKCLIDSMFSNPSELQNFFNSKQFKNISDQGLRICNIYDLVEVQYSFDFKKICDSIVQDLKKGEEIQ